MAPPLLARSAACAVAAVQAVASLAGPSPPLAITVDTSRPAAISSPALVSQAWESWGALFQFAHLHNDPRLIAIASHLAPGVLRVGGITADWVRYPGDGDSFGGSGGGDNGFWPAQPMNLTTAGFASLASFASAANLSLLFDLNELYGRNCSLVRPDCPPVRGEKSAHVASSEGGGGGGGVLPSPPPSWCTEWCGGPPEYPDWDESNMLAFLRSLHANGTGGPGATPFAYELGNELLGHLPLATNADDVARAHAALQSVWAGQPQPPPLLAAPATWSCQASAGTPALMANLSAAGAAEAFSFHMYPAGSPASFDAYAAVVTNASWLRGGLLQDPATNASACIAAWSAGPRAQGMDLWVTEANSAGGDAAAAPGPASFAAGFYTLAQYGLLAAAGVPLAARFALCCSPPGSGGASAVTYDPAADAFAVVPDYWVMLLRKRTAGDIALAVTGDGGGAAGAAAASPAAVFASCALIAVSGATDLADAGLDRLGGGAGAAASNPLQPRIVRGGGGNGSIVISAVNTASPGEGGGAALPLVLFSASGDPLMTTPRLEWVLTAPGLDADAPFLNGNTTAPLRVGADGSLPPLPGRYVPAGGPAELLLPPQSQAFFVLLGAGAEACMAAAAA
jgi:hypothetical protein